MHKNILIYGLQLPYKHIYISVFCVFQTSFLSFIFRPLAPNFPIYTDVSPIHFKPPEASWDIFVLETCWFFGKSVRFHKFQWNVRF